MMGRMTRTQISLDEQQYVYVKGEASSRGVSLSAVIRELIDHHRAERSREGPRLDDLVGFLGSDGLDGIDHDHYLYGWPRRSAETGS
jgi:hypothetical protein